MLPNNVLRESKKFKLRQETIIKNGEKNHKNKLHKVLRKKRKTR